MSAAEQRTASLVSGFMASIQEPRTPYISPDRFAAAAGMSLQALAGLAGVQREAIVAEPEAGRVQDRLRDMMRAIVAAAGVTGDVAKAVHWFRTERIADYRHKTAAELVSEGHLDAVLLYLEDLRNGAGG